MPVDILCPNPGCGEVYSVAEIDLGRLSRCEKCHAEFSLVPQTRLGAESSGIAGGPGSFLAETIEEDLQGQFGRYHIVKTLGKGGMGAVYLAHDGQLDRLVALKVPHRKFARDPEVRERFLREARAAARFDHPNFCPIHDTGAFDDIPYLTMPYIEGDTLAATIERGRPWDETRAAEVVRQLARALAEAHRLGIVHRDLKPANIMRDARGGLVIMDFGLARQLEGDEATLTAAGVVVGTPVYMSPEQAEGLVKEVGPRSDIYSLGVILYEMACGRRPFEGSPTRILAMILTTEPPSPSSHHAALSPALEAICLKAMARDPRDRYASMGEFAGALQGWLDEGPIREVEPGPGRGEVAIAHGRSRDSLATRPWVAAASVVLLGVLSGSLYLATRKGGAGARAENRVAVDRVDGEKVGAGSSGGPIARPGSKGTTAARLSPGEPDPFLINSVGMKLALIPAGEFQMGSNSEESWSLDDEMVDGKKHRVRITRPFYMGTTEVTVGQFRRFILKTKYVSGAEGGDHQCIGWYEPGDKLGPGRKYSWRSPGFPQTEDHPVVLVDWPDAVAFCDWLGKEEGQSYRLPTEAEWEYACRAGQATRYWMGDDPEALTTVGNVCDGSFKERWPSRSVAFEAKDGHAFPAPAGRFRPNPFGLYDVHGNVWEWCSDLYAPDYYKGSPREDPPGSDPTQSVTRVVRGGSWFCLPACGSAHRNKFNPNFRIFDIGFRVARDAS